MTILVRNEAKAVTLKARGVTIKKGDYFNKSSLLNAMEGIDKLLLISSSDFINRIDQHKNVVDAAKEKRVKHIYYTGLTMNKPEESVLKPLMYDHTLTEEYIKSSGLNYTFIENGLYAESIPMFIGEDGFENGVYVAAGEGKITFAERKDLGEAMAILLAGDGHENKTYNLTSTVATSFADLTAYLSELSGKTTPYISPDAVEYKATLKQFGLPQEIITMSVLFATAMKNNDFNTPYNTLENILGRKQADLKSFLKEFYKL